MATPYRECAPFRDYFVQFLYRRPQSGADEIVTVRHQPREMGAVRLLKSAEEKGS